MLTPPRTDQEMLDLLLSVARTDVRIRAVWLSGSRVDPAATQDRFNDFDVIYLVDGLPSMVQDDSWLEPFGPPLIVQRPDDWFNHPYDLTSHSNFAYLMYFPDGQRIDLTLIALEHIQSVLNDSEPEPRRILLDKEGILGLNDVPAGQFGRVFPPGEREFADTCNEFWWLSLSAAKGIERGEVLSAKTLIERYQLDMLLQVLAWKAGVERGFPLACGKFFKYLPRLLKPEDERRLMGVLAPHQRGGQWPQLLEMGVFFSEAVNEVAAALALRYDAAQTGEVLLELERLRSGPGSP
ncbi:aminoglycoside 6-adenylyltransferase [Deinococcus altitudinis]|uniref:aminoglycoside 6-adenylyltransferase n=1 Tax=Deinococcus altitudinis TaxID=468914 RepID=UPI003892A17E